MSQDAFYTSPEWLAVRERVLRRDSGRCSVARLLGGDCSPTLHVHHLQSRKERPDLELDEDNLLTACASHHPTLEAVCRLLRVIRLVDLPPCAHRHTYASGREQCERERRRAMLERRALRLSRGPQDSSRERAV